MMTHSSGAPSDGMATALVPRHVGRPGRDVPISDRPDFERHLRAAADDRVDGDDRTTPYSVDDGNATEGSFPFDEGIHATGSLISSVTEPSIYLRLYMNGGSVDGATLLDEASVGHGGSIGVSTAYVGHLDDAGVGVALLCNVAADPRPIRVGPAVLAIAWGADETAAPRFALDRVRPADGNVRGVPRHDDGDGRADGRDALDGVRGGEATRDLTLVPESLDLDDARFAVVTGAGKRTPATIGRG